jgi:putative ABC transport system permease protein
MGSGEMSFLKLILKNPFRNKSRALLAIVGIGIGIATIVALGGITAGLVASVDDTLDVGGADFSILNKEQNQAGTPYGTSTLSEDWLEKINSIDGVKNAEGVYIGLIPVDNNINSVTMGIPLDTGMNISSMGIKIVEGGMISNDSSKKEVIIGKLLLEDLNKKIGDTVVIGDEEYEIVGEYESGNVNLDSGAIASIESVQRLAGDEGKISIIYTHLDKGASVDDVTKRIEDKYGNDLSVISSLTDIETMASALDMINGASFGISLLAILIGGIGIINTMIMSIYERTREIGVLKAVGWKKRRILTMILGESLVLTVSSVIIGFILGVIGVELIAASGMLGAIYPVYTATPFIQAFTVAIIVGIIGGIYPAWKASQLPPIEALRNE